LDSKQLQSHIDELLLIEERVAERGQETLRLHQELKRELSGLSTQQNKLHQQMQSDRDVLYGLMAQAEARSEILQRAISKTRWLLVVTALGCVLVLGGTLWWRHSVSQQLVSTQTRLWYLREQLQALPEVFSYQGRAYIRIVPGSENRFEQDGKILPGRYAALWGRGDVLQKEQGKAEKKY